MIVDTSVLVAILEQEPESAFFSSVIAANSIAMSAGTLLEARIVAGSRGAGKGEDLEAMIRGGDIAIVAVDASQARIGADAYARYGRGSRHPAKLNYGDCFSYALAIARDEPLLFKGDDFVHTDVRVATAEI